MSMKLPSKHHLIVTINDLHTSPAQKHYLQNYLANLRKIHIYQIIILILFIVQWQALTHFKILDSFIFSSPSRVISTFLSMSKDGIIFYHMGITLYETLLSFTLVLILGLFLAVLLWWNESLSKVFEPYLVVLNSLPKSALAPVFIVWLGNNRKTIIMAAVSVAIFGSVITLYHDFTSVEEDKLKLVKTLGGTKKDMLFRIVLPSNIPSIISVMKVNIGLSLVGVIIGEFLAAKAGLGYLIIYGSQVFKLDWVIMSIILLCFMAVFLYQILAFLERKYRE